MSKIYRNGLGVALSATISSRDYMFSGNTLYIYSG